MQSIDTITAAGVQIGRGAPPVLLAGPCVVENRGLLLSIAESLYRIAENTGFRLFFKASFDKANRSFSRAFRGPGMDAGLQLLDEVKNRFQLPIVTDIHLPEQAVPVSQVVDIIQIPAFLCRQTDLLCAAAAAGRAVNIKKGQFMAPSDMRFAVEKVVDAGCSDVLLTERGTSFGYNDLVVDFRGIRHMQAVCPVVFDATHSVQQPGAEGGASGGVRECIPDLTLAAAAAGVDALFMEVHPDPSAALSDAASIFPLGKMENLLKRFLAVREAAAEPMDVR